MKKIVIQMLALLSVRCLWASPVVELEGSGTAAFPYLIKTANDMVELATAVNNDTEKTNEGITDSFSGVYFSLASDIDMSGLEFTPVGNAFSQVFAGVFEGNNHEISNVAVSTGSVGYAAIFGRVGENGVVRNLHVSNADISTEGFFAGVIVGDCLGNVSGCVCRNSTVAGRGSWVGGIVGRAVGNIENCQFYGGTVTGADNNTGGICGQNYAKVSDCSSNATVVSNATVATATVGGIAGSCYLQDALIANCYFAGMVSAPSNDLLAGGITGQLYKGNIEKSFNVGSCTVGSAKAAVGGIAGRADGGTVSDCYNSGYVSNSTSNKRIGGIIGYVVDGSDLETGDAIFTEVMNVYNVGMVVSDASQFDALVDYPELFGTVSANAKVSNAYFDKQMSSYGSQSDWGLATADMIAGTGLSGFSSEVWSFGEGEYPRLKAIGASDAVDTSVAPLFLAEGQTLNGVKDDFTVSSVGDWYVVNGEMLSKNGSVLVIDGVNVSLTGVMGVEKLVCKVGEFSRMYEINVEKSPFDGEGTAASPYLIQSGEDLKNLAEITTEKGLNYAGTFFKLAGDIDMENIEFIGVSADSEANGFAGVLDGAGYTIHHLEIDRVVFDEDGDLDKSNSNSYGGLFGYLAEDGVVKNLTVADDCDLNVFGYSGAFVGISHGTVDNCINKADVKGWANYVGGIVGANYGTITNCLNGGSVTTSSFAAGGICGINDGQVSFCANLGLVMSEFRDGAYKESNVRAAGGISGMLRDGAEICNSVNAGMVQALKQVGGIVGNGNAGALLSNVVNYGMVHGEDAATLGAVVGGAAPTSVTGAYFDNQLQDIAAAEGSDKDGYSGMPSSVLAASNLDGLDTSVWNLGDGHYPYLAEMAENTDVVGAAYAYVGFAEGESAADVRTNAKLGVTDGLTWTLESGANFAIVNGVLTVVSPGSDVLIARCGSYEKQIAVSTTIFGVVEYSTTSRKVVGTTYYAASGVEVLMPQDGHFYIVKILYDDETMDVRRVLYEE